MTRSRSVFGALIALVLLLAACGAESAPEEAAEDGAGAATEPEAAGDTDGTETDGDAAAGGEDAPGAEEVDVESVLPDVMSLVSYDVGSSNYNQAQALGEGLRDVFGIRLRILPSGTGTGRMTLVVNEQVDMGFLADEGAFAAEGLYDFATREWGPQELRAVWSIPEQFGLPVAASSDIETVEDLEGRRIAVVPGNPALNVKQAAVLAFGGLTYDDMEIVEVGSYGDALRQLLEGRIDTVAALPTAAAMTELEATEGVRWLSLDEADEEGWERLNAVYPWGFPSNPTVQGSGYTMEEAEDLWFLGYRSPYVSVRADAPDEFAYAAAKAIHESYGSYESLFPKMPDWNIDLAGRPGGPEEGLPFHEGAVQYLTDQGVWNDEYDEWNEARVEHLSAVRSLWEETMDQAAEEQIPDTDFPQFWMDQRAAEGWFVGLGDY